MKLKKLLLGMVTACLVYQISSCVNNQRKYKASLTKPSEMIAVGTDDPDPQDITEQVHKVREAAKKDYKSVIKELKTPLEAKLYCTKILEYKPDSEIYGKEDYWASFKYVHKNKKDDCDGAAFAVAAILSDDSFPPYIAILSKESTPNEAHAVFVYKTTGGKYCSIGINVLDCLFKCDSMEELTNKLGYDSFEIYNISGYSGLEKLLRGVGFDSFQIYNIIKYLPNYVDNNKNNDVRR